MIESCEIWSGDFPALYRSEINAFMDSDDLDVQIIDVSKTKIESDHPVFIDGVFSDKTVFLGNVGRPTEYEDKSPRQPRAMLDPVPGNKKVTRFAQFIERLQGLQQTISLGIEVTNADLLLKTKALDGIEHVVYDNFIPTNGRGEVHGRLIGDGKKFSGFTKDWLTSHNIEIDRDALRHVLEVAQDDREVLAEFLANTLAWVEDEDEGAILSLADVRDIIASQNSGRTPPYAMMTAIVNGDEATVLDHYRRIDWNALKTTGTTISFAKMFTDKIREYTIFMDARSADEVTAVLGKRGYYTYKEIQKCGFDARKAERAMSLCNATLRHVATPHSTAMSYRLGGFAPEDHSAGDKDELLMLALALTRVFAA